MLRATARGPSEACVSRCTMPWRLQPQPLRRSSCAQLPDSPCQSGSLPQCTPRRHIARCAGSTSSVSRALDCCTAGLRHKFCCRHAYKQSGIRLSQGAVDIDALLRQTATSTAGLDVRWQHTESVTLVGRGVGYSTVTPGQPSNRAPDDASDAGLVDTTLSRGVLHDPTCSVYHIAPAASECPAFLIFAATRLSCAHCATNISLTCKHWQCIAMDRHPPGHSGAL